MYNVYTCILQNYCVYNIYLDVNTHDNAYVHVVHEHIHVDVNKHDDVYVVHEHIDVNKHDDVYVVHEHIDVNKYDDVYVVHEHIDVNTRVYIYMYVYTHKHFLFQTPPVSPPYRDTVDMEWMSKARQ